MEKLSCDYTAGSSVIMKTLESSLKMEKGPLRQGAQGDFLEAKKDEEIGSPLEHPEGSSLANTLVLAQ